MIGTFSQTAIASSVVQDPRTALDDTALRPFTLEINRTDWGGWFRADSLRISDILGQPVSCEFTVVNPLVRPKPGDVVRVLYYAEVLFAGLVDRIETEPSVGLTVIDYRCTCTDWSILLTRRKIRRNFTDLPIINIVDSILDNELSGEGLTIGTIDRGTTIPLVDVKNARVFDVLRDLGGATGQSMYVDFSKAIQFRTTSNETSPKPLTNETVEASSIVEDLETYRNVQTVIVTGTPASAGQDALSVSVTRQHNDQIAARQAVEGGTGRVEEIEEITHPTSNDGVDLALMGIGYGNLRLATSGVPRKTLRARVRGYGFRAGQFVTVDLPAVGATGTWLIQKASFREQAVIHLVWDLEVTQSSRQQRAYESWLSIVQAGKVVVQLPGSVTSNLVTFSTPGADTWTVPAGVTEVEVTCIGAGGGCGGCLRYKYWFGSPLYYVGGNGGNGGRAVSILSVQEGDVLSLTIGAGGLGGDSGTSNSALLPYGITPTSGAAGSSTYVSYDSAVVAQADPGSGGTNAYVSTPYIYAGTNGSDGGGAGDAVSVGGGSSGGVFDGYGDAPHTQSSGSDGSIEIRW